MKKPFCCFHTTARDVARFGSLLLHRGNWQAANWFPKPIWTTDASRFVPERSVGKGFTQLLWYLRRIMTQLKESIWALLFPFGIIAGLRMGMFTPSEAGAVAVVYCILVGVFIYKELKWEYAWPIMKETIYGTSSVVLIIVAASFFGYYLNWERIPQHITSAMLDFTRNPYMMLMLVISCC